MSLFNTVFCMARQNFTSSKTNDQHYTKKKEHSLETSLWRFIATFMLQAARMKEMSAQECLSRDIFLEIQSGSSLTDRWQCQESRINTKGDLLFTMLKITEIR